MGTLTSRVKAFKAALLDPVDVVADIQGPFDIFDAETGLPIVANGNPLPVSPYDGQIRYDKNDNVIKQYDAAATIWKPLLPGPAAALQGAGGAWKTITPTLTNVTIGTATQKNILDYIRMPGNLIFWRYVMVLGTGGSLTGVMSVTLPVEFPFDISAGVNAGITGETLGAGRAIQGTARGLIATINGVGPPGNMSFLAADTGSFVSNVVPAAWAAGNTLTAAGFYRTSAT